MKAATTTLAAQLGAQEGLFMPAEKEPDFFAQDDLSARGVDGYARFFARAPETALIGEASTSYAKLPDLPGVPDRLLAAVPDAKLIYCVRHPLARARSHAFHEIRKGRHRGRLDDAVRHIPALWHYGSYAHQLAPWMAQVPKERILIVAAERLRQCPEDEFSRVLAFLGVEGTWRKELATVHGTAESYRDIPAQKLLIDSPIARGLRRRLIPKSWRTRIRRTRTVDLSDRFSPEAEAFLAARLGPDLEDFGRLCGRQLDLATYDEAVRAAPLALR